MRIELSNCVIRSPRLDDAASLVKHANDPAVWANLLDVFPQPYTTADANEWLQKAGQQVRPTEFAIAVHDELIGVIGFLLLSDEQSHFAEMGYWLGQEYWGRGIATEAVRAITSYVFSGHHEIRRLYARVFEWNVASMRVLEKCGYYKERRLRQSVVKAAKLVDEMLYVKLRDND